MRHFEFSHILLNIWHYSPFANQMYLPTFYRIHFLCIIQKCVVDMCMLREWKPSSCFSILTFLISLDRVYLFFCVILAGVLWLSKAMINSIFVVYCTANLEISRSFQSLINQLTLEHYQLWVSTYSLQLFPSKCNVFCWLSYLTVSWTFFIWMILSLSYNLICCPQFQHGAFTHTFFLHY